MSRRLPDNENEPASTVEQPILTAVGPYAFFAGSGHGDAQAELTNLLDALAVAYGGEGYLSYLRSRGEPENERGR